MLWNIAVNDAGAEYDPLTLLRSRTMFGRPDWKSIYSRMRQAIEAGLNVRTNFTMPQTYIMPLRDLVKEGKVSMKTLDSPNRLASSSRRIRAGQLLSPRR